MQGLDGLRSISFAVSHWILCRVMEQGGTALHTPQPGTAAHGLPLTPGPSRWSRASLAPAQTQQMMLIRECRTLGRPGCSFCSEASPCFLIKYLQLQKRQNSVQILTARFMCGKNPKERKKRKKKESQHLSHINRKQEEKDTVTQKSVWLKSLRDWAECGC